jgi:anti-sigma-K factor RskA
LVAVTDILPLSLDEMEPSAGLRDRIEAAVLADTETPAPASPEPVAAPPRPKLVTPPRNVSWLSSRTTKAIVSAAAILLIAVSVIAIALNMRGTETETIDVATLPQNVSGTLTYQPDDKKFTFDVEGMPQPPEGHVYQVWLIAGDSPKSVGIMHGDEFETRADRDKYDAFAITVEPSPDGSAGPTTAPIVVAPLHA